MDNLTPMLKQYQEIKARYANCILFFRLGDFYEMFGEDARKASGILDVALTSRDAGKSGRIPMCGIPYHSAPTYIPKLIKAGLKVAICEQLETPEMAKGIVRRDVTRVVTPSLVADPDLVSEETTNYLFVLDECADGRIEISTLDLLGAVVRHGYIHGERNLTDLFYEL